MTTEKRKRGRPKKNIETTVEKAEVAPHIAPSPEPVLKKILQISAWYEDTITKPQVVASGQYFEKTDRLQLEPSTDNIGLRRILKSFESGHPYYYNDPVTHSKTMIKQEEGEIWMEYLHNADLKHIDDGSRLFVSVDATEYEAE